MADTIHYSVLEDVWVDPKSPYCTYCQKNFMLEPLDFKDGEVLPEPIILTDIDNVSLDENKYFCTFSCMEDWFNSFVVKHY